MLRADTKCQPIRRRRQLALYYHYLSGPSPNVENEEARAAAPAMPQSLLLPPRLPRGVVLRVRQDVFGGAQQKQARGALAPVPAQVIYSMFFARVTCHGAHDERLSARAVPSPPPPSLPLLG